jgi:hypothetical protein
VCGTQCLHRVRRQVYRSPVERPAVARPIEDDAPSARALGNRGGFWCGFDGHRPSNVVTAEGLRTTNESFDASQTKPARIRPIDDHTLVDAARPIARLGTTWIAQCYEFGPDPHATVIVVLVDPVLRLGRVDPATFLYTGLKTLLLADCATQFNFLGAGKVATIKPSDPSDIADALDRLCERMDRARR